MAILTDNHVNEPNSDVYKPYGRLHSVFIYLSHETMPRCEEYNNRSAPCLRYILLTFPINELWVSMYKNVYIFLTNKHLLSCVNISTPASWYVTYFGGGIIILAILNYWWPGDRLNIKIISCRRFPLHREGNHLIVLFYNGNPYIRENVFV